MKPKACDFSVWTSPGFMLFNPNNVADCSFNRLEQPFLKLFSLPSKVLQAELTVPQNSPLHPISAT